MYQYQQSLPYLSLKVGSPPVATRDLVIFMFCSTLEWCCGDDEPSSSPPTTLHCTGSSCPAYQLTFLSPLAKHSGSVQPDIGIFSNLGGPGPGPGRQYWKVGSISLSALSSLLLLPSPFYTNFPPVLPIHSPGAECGRSTFFLREREDHVTCWANTASRQEKLTSPANIECGLPVQNIHPTVFISNNFSFILDPGSYCYGLIERNKKLYKYLTNTPSQG